VGDFHETEGRIARSQVVPYPVILVTGHGDHDVLNEFGEARILPKPYPEEDLVNRVGAALNRHKPLPE
jgi:FixJ family two-component response regulator